MIGVYRYPFGYVAPAGQAAALAPGEPPLPTGVPPAPPPGPVATTVTPGLLLGLGVGVLALGGLAAYLTRQPAPTYQAVRRVTTARTVAAAARERRALLARRARIAAQERRAAKALRARGRVARRARAA